MRIECEPVDTAAQVVIAGSAAELEDLAGWLAVAVRDGRAEPHLMSEDGVSTLLLLREDPD